MSKPVFIIDTNVVVAGLITAERQSPTARVLDCTLNGRLFFLLSAPLLREYRDVLLRHRIAHRHGLNETEIEQLLTEITANAIWRESISDAIHSAPDPGDAHLWALIASEPTSILITGDRLLIDNPRPQSSIISPRTWAQHFQNT